MGNVVNMLPKVSFYPGIIAAVVSRRHVPLALLESLSRSEVIFARACALLGFIVQLDLYTRVKGTPTVFLSMHFQTMWWDGSVLWHSTTTIYY